MSRFLFAAMAVSLGLAACGSSSSPVHVPFNLIADCAASDTACGSTGSGSALNYTGSGTGVWRFSNTGDLVSSGDITISNVSAGQTVSLVVTNTQTAEGASTVTPGYGTLNSPVSPVLALALGSSVQKVAADSATQGVRSHLGLQEQARKILEREREAAKKAAASGIAPKASPSLMSTVPLASAVMGDTRPWYETYSKSNKSAQVVAICDVAATGRRVVFWLETGVSYAGVSDLQSAFCGTQANSYGDGQYAKVVALLGDAWGPSSTIPSGSFFSSRVISETSTAKQDVNIVIVDPGATAQWGGYFWSINNYLTTASMTGSSEIQNSNEALVFFVNAREPTHTMNSVLIHELTHMLNFYQRGVLHNDFHEIWLEETSAMMTQDIFDLGLIANISDNCLPVVCNLLSYAQGDGSTRSDYPNGGAGVSYFDWPSASSGSLSAASYYIGGGFALFLNRRYGPVIAAQLITDCYTPSTNTSSVACLDALIKKNGGSGFADDYARYGASVFGVLGDAAPGKYGFPSIKGTLMPTDVMSTSMDYNIPAVANWMSTGSSIGSAKSLSSLLRTTHTYQIDTVADGKTAYVRKGVAVPPKTQLIVVVK